MDKATDDSARPSGGSSQPFSQPSRLCRACSSVLERQDLELQKFYPHHSSLAGFIEAADEGCYVCSQLFSSLQIWCQENLRLLAVGKPPVEDSIDKSVLIHGQIIAFPEIYSDQVARDARFRDMYGQPSFVSFTMMKLVHIPCEGGEERETYKMGYWRITVKESLMYEAYLPPHLGAYHSSLKLLWKCVGHDMGIRQPYDIIPRKCM